MVDCRYAFRIVGSPKGGKRRLVDAASATQGYADCDPRCQLDTQSYLSAFWYADDFQEYLSSRGTTEGFDGVCWSPFLWFDIDREDNLELALDDTRQLVNCFVGDFCAPTTAVEIYFSGGKGFHVGLSTSLWSPEPSKTYHKTARAMAVELAGVAGVGIDESIYSKVQPFRAENSRHAKTGLYKRRLTDDELLQPMEKILDDARQPRSFNLIDAHYPPNERLRVLWVTAGEIVSAADRQPQKSSRGAADESAIISGDSEHSATPKLNRQTLEFIRGGAAAGDRHRILFSAAANLAEFYCPVELAHALLTEVALDSGLSPSETRRQIDCGLRKGGDV